MKPLTIEEAVKDAEFRDRDLLIFHDPAGDAPGNTSGVWLEREVFERFYAGRGVAVELPRA